MPRPRKCRRVCRLPENAGFGPLSCGGTAEGAVNMTVEEYEAIRLIDLEGFTQEECAKQMNVARTTVQAMYNDARKKLADALVNGRMLVIDGGDYILCDGAGEHCGGCRRNRRRGGQDRCGE